VCLLRTRTFFSATTTAAACSVAVVDVERGVQQETTTIILQRRRITLPELQARTLSRLHTHHLKPFPHPRHRPSRPSTPVILDSSTPDDSMPDDDHVHHSFTPSATGAPPATTHAQPTPPLSASKPARDAPYVYATPEMGPDSLPQIHRHEGRRHLVPHLTRLARKVEGRLQSGFKDTGERSRRAAWPRRQLGYRRSKRRTHPGALRGQPCHLRITTRHGAFHRMVLSLLYFTALSCSHPADRRYGPPKYPIPRKSSPRAISTQSASNSILTR
jgi:hypothetical protein